MMIMVVPQMGSGVLCVGDHVYVLSKSVCSCGGVVMAARVQHWVAYAEGGG